MLYLCKKFEQMEKRDKDNARPRRMGNDKKPSFKRSSSFSDKGKSQGRRFDKKFDKEDSDEKRRSFRRPRDPEKENRLGHRPARKFDAENSDRPKRRFNKEEQGANSFAERPTRKFSGIRSAEDRIKAKRDAADKRKSYFDKKEERQNSRKRDITAESAILSEIVAKRHAEGRGAPQRQKVLSLEFEEQHGPMRLNKYIANAGICSRRDADVLIESGAIMVNGEVVTELGTKVMPTDEVRYGDQVLQREKPVFVLLNKPKDYITTLYDERGRKNVIDLVRGACKERIYPVGRLDKNTTGVLLFTNDGEMTKKLTHPRSNVQKTYHVELDRNLTHADFQAIAAGIELDDGVITPDEIAYVGDSKKEIGITIHSGKNRIVRRIFESLEYKVVKLDRVVFAGLTKKDLPRGSWRFLTPAEINILHLLPKQQPLL